MYGDTAKWDKIIHRPLPGWYSDMKFGVFIHWGPYSVPSYGTEWFWHNYQCSGPGDPGTKGKPNSASVRAFADKNFPGVKSDYPQYADMFHAELYDATDWVTAIKGSGAQYVLPVAKHHDVSTHSCSESCCSCRSSEPLIVLCRLLACRADAHCRGSVCGTHATLHQTGTRHRSGPSVMC